MTTRIFEDALTDTSQEPATREMLELMRGHLREDGITPDEAARRIFDGIAERRFWIPTHPQRFAEIATRRAAMLTELATPQGNVATEITQRAAHQIA